MHPAPNPHTHPDSGRGPATHLSDHSSRSARLVATADVAAAAGRLPTTTFPVRVHCTTQPAVQFRRPRILSCACAFSFFTYVGFRVCVCAAFCPNCEFRMRWVVATALHFFVARFVGENVRVSGVRFVLWQVVVVIVGNSIVAGNVGLVAGSCGLCRSHYHTRQVHSDRSIVIAYIVCIQYSSFRQQKCSNLMFGHGS